MNKQKDWSKINKIWAHKTFVKTQMINIRKQKLILRRHKAAETVLKEYKRIILIRIITVSLVWILKTAINKTSLRIRK